MTTFCDAHCHLQDFGDDDHIATIIARAKCMGVSHMHVCGTRREDWGRVLEIRDRWPDCVTISLGIHPWYVDENAYGDVKRLWDIIKDDSSIGVGEIGLDWCDNRPGRNLQRDIFLGQMDTALELNRPVSIHCVRAFGDLLEVLNTLGRLDAGGIVHAFSGSAEVRDRLILNNLSLSFGCAVLNKKNTRAREALATCLESSMIFESDAPSLPPPCRAQSEPADVLSIVETAALLRGGGVAEIALVAADNYRAVYTAS